MTKKTLGNLKEETHKEVVIIKANKGFKSIEQTIRFLLDVYKKDKIRQEIENEENIKNSNIEEIKQDEEVGV